MGEASFHAATAEQDGDAPLDASAETLPLPESGALLVGFTLRSSASSALWDGDSFDAVLLTGVDIVLAVEAAISTIQFGDVAKYSAMTFERSLELLLVGRVAVQNLILRNQTAGAFRQKDFMTEFDRSLHLAAFDQIGVGFEDGIDFLAGSSARFLCAVHRSPCL